MDRLIQGIESIKIKNRCSLSDEEVKLLTDCQTLLRSLHQETSVSVRKLKLSKVIEFLLRVFHNDISGFLDQL